MFGVTPQSKKKKKGGLGDSFSPSPRLFGVCTCALSLLTLGHGMEDSSLFKNLFAALCDIARRCAATNSSLEEIPIVVLSVPTERILDKGAARRANVYFGNVSARVRH